MSALERDRSRLIDAVVTTMRRREGTGSNPDAGLDLVTAIRSAGIKVPIIVYSDDVNREQRTVLLTFPDVSVTSSFVELLNRLGGRCAGCGKVLIGDQFFREHDRVPCPNCRATTRQFFRTVTERPFTSS
jgi:phage FluMu protein Com